MRLSTKTVEVKQAAGSPFGETKILPNDGAANDYFGGSVSISGDHAIVGTSGDGDNGSNSGSAYVFEESASIPTVSEFAITYGSISPSPTIAVPVTLTMTEI